MEQLSGLDASFLRMESSRTPMHVGGIYLCDAATMSKPFDYEEFKLFLNSRLHLSKLFRRRLVEIPLNLDIPYWMEDPDFDLEQHIVRVALPRPGSMKELLEMAGQLFTRPLNRIHPLWRVTIVEGLDNVEGVAPGSFAIITKVHHAAVDGISGGVIMSALYDSSAEPRRRHEAKAWRPERVPGVAELLMRAYVGSLQRPFRIARLVQETAGSVVDMVRRDGLSGLKPPTAPFSAPETRFNKLVCAHRIVSGKVFALEQFKNIARAVEEVNLNDVVIAVCSGALRHYLKRKGELPDIPLIALAPISTRKFGQRGGLGNHMSPMFLSLATNESDPVNRLTLIHESAVNSKMYNQALPSEKLAEFIPSETASLAARLYTRIRASRRGRPAFNVVINNVPGPQTARYVNGARVISKIGMSTLYEGMGLVFSAFSYDGTMSIGVTSCRSMMPDIDEFMNCLEESLFELEDAVAGITAESLDSTEKTIWEMA